GDTDDAVRLLELAAGGFDELEMAVDAAVARLDAAEVLRGAGRGDAAGAQRPEVRLQVAHARPADAARLQAVDLPPPLLDLVEERGDLLLVAVAQLESGAVEDCGHAASLRTTGSAAGSAGAGAEAVGRRNTPESAAPTRSSPVSTISATRKPW